MFMLEKQVAHTGNYYNCYHFIYCQRSTESGQVSLWVNPPPNYKEQADIRQRKILGREDLKLLHGFSRTKRMNGAVMFRRFFCLGSMGRKKRKSHIMAEKTEIESD